MSGHTKWSDIKHKRYAEMSAAEVMRVKFEAHWKYNWIEHCHELAAAYPRSYGLCSLEPGHEGDHLAVTGWPWSRHEVVEWPQEDRQ